VLPRLFLLALAVIAVVQITQRVLERERAKRDARPALEDRLARLDDLLRRELITRAEYDAARLRLLTGEAGEDDRPV
jgi:murein tripeptide amidase MpaA